MDKSHFAPGSQVRVLHVIARMNRGGTARYLTRLMTAPELSGFNQLLAKGIVQGAEIEDESVGGLNVIQIHTLGRAISPFQDFRAYKKLKKVIEEFSPDIIHSHTFKAGVIARLQSTTAKKIHTFHGHLFDDQEFSSLKKMIIRLIEGFLAHRTDLLVSVGSQVGVELRAAGIGQNEEWVSIPPGVEPLSLKPKSQARRSLGLPDDDRVIIGWMARVTGVKNPQLFLEVVRETPEYLYVMAGSGDLSDEIAAAKPENLHIVGWADAATVISAVDLMLSTSDNEGMPISLIESQLAGLPVVATNVGSNSEVVISNHSGIITSRDKDEIVQAVKSLASNPELRANLGAAARLHAETYFAPAKMGRTHSEIYCRLVGK